MDELILFPVAGWEIGTIPAYGALFIRFEFLSHSMQEPGKADPGRRYALQPEQAREIRDAIDRALQKLQNAGPPKAEGPTH